MLQNFIKAYAILWQFVTSCQVYMRVYEYIYVCMYVCMYVWLDFEKGYMKGGERWCMVDPVASKTMQISGHELWESLYSYMLIKLSPYQHLCCIVSLIVSFCSIKSPIFAVFIHISPRWKTTSQLWRIPWHQSFGMWRVRKSVQKSIWPSKTP